MLEANVNIIGELKEFLSLVSRTPDLLRLFKNRPEDFTRIRKLPFERLALLITNLCKKTLSVELDNFFEEFNPVKPFSVSAFTQQRMKLSPEFFKCWNEVLCAGFYTYYGPDVKRWNGYRVIAGDGSSVALINNSAMKEHFGGQRNRFSAFTLGKAFFCYDVLNGLVISSRLERYRYSELDMAYDHIDKLQPDMLMIYDRNFSNYKMVALHQLQEQQIKFVIRAKDSQNVIKAFIAGGKQSEDIWLSPSPNAIKGLRKSQFIVTANTRFRVRLVRVELQDKVEVLMTNLWEEEGYKSEIFKELYRLRWEVETNIGFQKNTMGLESFSGLTPTAVLQDFYATVLVANLHALLIKPAQQTIEKITVHRKHLMKVNNNKAFGKIKTVLVHLFQTQDTKAILNQLHDYFIRAPLPIRPGRSYPRVRLNLKARSKHKTFANFKPAY